MRYIKWLSINDWALEIQLKRMDEIMNNYVAHSEPKDINDIMELYVVCKYMDAKIYPSIWDKIIVDKNVETTKRFKSILGRYFNSLKEEEFIDVFKVLESDYKKLFWEAFGVYKLYKKIGFSCIKTAIVDRRYAIRNLLYEKAIVDAYGESIRDELLDFEKSAEWLLDEYEVYHEHERNHLYFPKELTVDDKKQIIEKYIDCADANLNYLQIIVNIQDNPDTLSIGDKARLKARKRVDEEQKELFSDGGNFKTEINVVFAELKENDSEFDMDPRKIVCKYNSNWIKENLDEPTLLNNFIYWFGYVDMQWRIALVEKEAYKGIVERFLFMRSRYAYTPGYSTNTLNLLADIQMAAYYQQLEINGIRLENVYKWFFEKYLKDEFLIDGFRMNVPSMNTSYLEKCRTMLSEMDGILKQYNLFVEDGYVDQELFQISSSHMKICDCKSAVKEKYVYGIGEEYRIACHHLFSDQSHITYVKRIEKSYGSFFELLENEKIYDTDFGEYTTPIFGWLAEHRYILLDDHEIKFDNLLRIRLLKQLNDNGVISYWHLGNESRSELKAMEGENLVVFKATLFAQREYEYFDYYLNKATFNNGTDLRNMYLHGSQPNRPEDEKIHMHNYWIILKLFVLCILKICDDVETMTYIKTRVANVE